MRRLVLPLSLAVIGGLMIAAWPATEALGFGDALPVLVGDVPAGGFEQAVVEAGALILVRIGAVFLAPVLVLGAALDLAVLGGQAVTGLMRRSSLRGAKGPTPEPVGSTGGGL